MLRFDYGRLVPWVRRVGGDICAASGPDAVCLRTNVPVHGEGLTTKGEFTVRKGETFHFVLSWHPSHLEPYEPPHPGGALERTLTWWRDWCARGRYEGLYAREVQDSLMVLKAMDDVVATDKPIGQVQPIAIPVGLDLGAVDLEEIDGLAAEVEEDRALGLRRELDGHIAAIERATGNDVELDVVVGFVCAGGSIRSFPLREHVARLPGQRGRVRHFSSGSGELGKANGGQRGV